MARLLDANGQPLFDANGDYLYDANGPDTVDTHDGDDGSAYAYWERLWALKRKRELEALAAIYDAEAEALSHWQYLEPTQFREEPTAKQRLAQSLGAPSSTDTRIHASEDALRAILANYVKH